MLLYIHLGVLRGLYATEDWLVQIASTYFLQPGQYRALDDEVRIRLC